MTISYYKDEPKAVLGRRLIVIQAMIYANIALATLMVFAWPQVGWFVTEPLAWATWHPFHRSGFGVDIFEYPFILLWLLPLAGATISWMALNARQAGYAFGGAIVPLVLLLMVFGWFYGAPTELR